MLVALVGSLHSSHSGCADADEEAAVAATAGEDVDRALLREAAKRAAPAAAENVSLMVLALSGTVFLVVGTYGIGLFMRC